MSVVFLFIDGVGLGQAKDSNPFYNTVYPGFSAMAGKQSFTQKAQEVTETLHLFKSVDANLGVEGLPQSGTGQTALFSGKNASKEIGKHFGPFPHSGIRHLLKKQSLFLKAQQLGKSCQFINAYPDIFFKKVQETGRWSCTTLMTKNADLRLNETKDVKNERALTAELTQKAWQEKLNIDVPEISPGQAANRLLERSNDTDLLLHEYYLTDKAGHSQKLKTADQYLSDYSKFLQQLIDQANKDTTIVLCSDHGNIEDLSTKTHSRNKVPLFAYGKGARNFEQASSIMDVTPGIIKTLGE